MELEYKLAAIIGSCVNEGQLFTARECILKAGNRLMHDEFVYLRKLADHKETALKQQMVDFANNTEAVTNELEVLPLDDASLNSDNVEKCALGIKYTGDGQVKQQA